MESLEHSFDTTASLSALTSRLGEMRLTHLRVLFDEWHSDKLLPTFGLTLSTIPSDCLVELRLTLMDNNISESFGLVKASHRTLVRLSLRDGVEQRRHIHQAVVSNIPILSAVRYLTFGATSREAGDGRLIKPFIHMAVTASQLLDLTLQGEHWDPEYVFDILRACVGPIEKMTLDGSFSYFELYEMAKSSGRGHAFPRIRYLRMAEVFDGLDDLKFLPELFPTLTSVTFDYIDGTDAEGLSVLLLNPFSLPMLEEVSIGLFLHNREFPKALAELREICKERRIDLDIWDIG